MWITHTIYVDDPNVQYFTIDAPPNIYCGPDNKLSVYGQGFIDGATDLHYTRPMHKSIQRTNNDSDTRRAYVSGYLDAYRPNWAVNPNY